ncbi:MAG TPA: xanthine dehydrogenase family protein molybdopterin-binding subunit [Vineibacter sp.]|nr:xanthine dehydrogenase family protein molybdopterin-binding subunit [Vineibacter sp.]
MAGTGIGARVRRKEDERHTRGRGRFIGDIHMQGLQDVAFLRSPQAHARIRSILKPAGAESEVYTTGDLVGLRPIVTASSLPGYKVSTHPPLADGKVRFVGEPLAMAVARTRAAAEDLCERITVDLEPLVPVVTADAARAPDAPKVHDDWDDNVFLLSTFDSGIDDAVRSAPIKVVREYRTARHCIHPMEGKGLIAHWDHLASQLVVITSTQIPHVIRTGLAQCLDIAQERIRVIAPDVGGGFGYKSILQPEELLLAWLALTHKRPFRWLEDRREHLTAGANTRQHQYRITAYADASGRLLGVDAEAAVDAGAYSVWPYTACLEGAQIVGNLPGPYDFQSYRCRSFTVATNKPFLVPYRGVSRPGVCFAMELTIDAIARAAGREPADVRAENLIPADAMPYTSVTGKHFDSGDYGRSLERAKAMIDLPAIRDRQKRGEADGRRIGVGFAIYTEQSAHGGKAFTSWGLTVIPGFDQASVKLTPDGGVEVRSGIHTIGQGLETTLAQMASDALTIPIERITVTLGDTATTPYSTGAIGSRGIVMAGGAVLRAAQQVARQARRLAAHLMQCTPDAVTLRDGRLVCGQASVSFADICSIWYLRPDQLPDDVDRRGLEATEAYKPDVDTGVFSYATHAALVAVDTETGGVEILDYVIVEDCGRRVNPMIVEGQTFGGAAQGIGTALFEESPFDDQGQPLASTLIDYLLPGPTELPHIRLDHFETLSPYTEHGIKGAGEGGAIAPAAAIVNGINDALASLGVEITELPATPERILHALHVAGAKGIA